MRLKSEEFVLRKEFCELDDNILSNVENILSGKVVGKLVCHIWYDEETGDKTWYNGKIDKLKKKAGGTYVVSYWAENESSDDAIDFDLNKYALAADMLCEDLTMS